MAETLEFRKQRMKEGLEEYYSQQPAKRWMEPLVNYQTTREKARENHEPLPPDGLSIKYDLKGALIYCAPFLLMIMLMLIQGLVDKNTRIKEDGAFGFFDAFSEQAIKLNEPDHKPGMIAQSIEFFKASAKK